MCVSLYLGVPGGDVLVGATVLLVRVSAVGTNDVDVARDDEAEDLLARPEGPRFQDGWLGHLAVPRRKEHQQVHHLTLKGQRDGSEKDCLKDHATATIIPLSGECTSDVYSEPQQRLFRTRIVNPLLQQLYGTLLSV